MAFVNLLELEKNAIFLPINLNFIRNYQSKDKRLEQEILISSLIKFKDLDSRGVKSMKASLPDKPYYGTSNSSQIDFIANTYIPFVTDCEGIGSHLSLWQLIEWRDPVTKNSCDLVRINKTEYIRKWQFSGHK